MSAIKWLEGNRIQIAPPKKTKKITGTRFATILGLNPWSTAFEMWCAITKTYEKPFEDTIYTIAGKTIEPKQAAYMKKSYAMDIITPTDIWGKDYFNKTWGDFFPDSPHLGGMWDYLSQGEDGKVDAVEDPKKFKPSAKNTITVEFKVSERYPDFAEKVALVEKWWEDHVDTGISPEYDEKKDAEILTALRTNTLTPETDIEALVAEAEALKKELDEVAASTAEKEKRLKTINDIIKEHAMSQFRDGDKKVEVKGSVYVWTVSRSETTGIDKDALKADGLLDKYSKKSVQYRMTVK